MNLFRSFALGVLGVLAVFSARAQFTSNSITGITAASVFGTNAPGSLTASNRFSTNALGWLTASNRFATNALGWLTASNTFNTNAPGSLTASNRFTGTAQRVGIVTTNTATTYKTNFGLTVSGAGTTAVNGTNYIYTGITNNGGTTVTYQMGTNDIYLGGSGTWGMDLGFFGNLQYGTPDAGATNPTGVWQNQVIGSLPKPTVSYNSSFVILTNVTVTITTNYP